MKIFRSFLLSFGFFLGCFLSLSLASSSFAEDQVVPININTADSVAISTALKGVGSQKAQAIIRYRENYGPFQAIEELASVKGIGQSLLDKNRDLIVLE